MIEDDRGLPQFIWLVIRDAKIQRVEYINEEYAKKIPCNLREYIETIIARNIENAEHDDKITTLAILLLMIKIPSQSINEELMWKMYEKILGRKGTSLEKVIHYLARRENRVIIPCDSWENILAKPEILAREIREAQKKLKNLTPLMKRIIFDEISKGHEKFHVELEFLREIEKTAKEQRLIPKGKIYNCFLDEARELIRRRKKFQKMKSHIFSVDG